MPFMTEYYLKIKLVDGSSPTKKRVVLFRRSTHAIIMTINKVDVPSDGILTISGLDPAIPAKDIYAIAFDDDGNRQLAGADKLSVLSRQVWVDKALAFHVEFNPGETTNERVTNSPMAIFNTPSVVEFVNGVLTNFPVNTAIITEKGLSLHNTIINYCKLQDNVVPTGGTVTYGTFNSLKLVQIRETTVTSTHTFEIDLTVLGNNVTTYAKNNIFSMYLKKSNAIDGVFSTIFQFLDSADNIIFAASYSWPGAVGNITSQLDSGAGLPTFKTMTDPRFPDYKFFHFNFVQPTNRQVKKLMVRSETMGGQSYAGDVTSGYDLWGATYQHSACGTDIPPFSDPSTTAAFINSTIGNSGDVTRLNFYYNPSTLSPLLSPVLLMDTNAGNSIMLEAILQMKFNRTGPFAVASNHNNQAITAFLSLDAGESPNYYPNIRATGMKANKTNCAIAYDTNWDAFDIIRIRMFADKMSDIPAAVKSHYGLTPTNMPLAACVAIYENLTKGTKVIKKDAYLGIGLTLDASTGAISQSVNSTSTYNIGPYVMKKLKVYTKPLPTDWPLETNI